QLSRGYTPATSLTPVSLFGESSFLVPALSDVASANRRTFNSLWWRSTLSDNHVMTLGWDWPLSNLTLLYLEGNVAACFDLQSLMWCPALYSLELNVGRKLPQDWDIETKVRQLTQVSSTLRCLELSGWWSLTDELLLGELLPTVNRLF